ncbi:MAG: hypothetical protein AAF127_14025 [Pseudomonadota bacterium]
MALDCRMSVAVAALLSLTACDALSGHDHDHDHDHADEAFIAADEPLGVMTSLPLLWPLDASVDDIASGNAPMPWVGAQMEQRFNLVALDSLSPAAEGEGASEPLADLSKLAIIQPRSLSAQDNVALDKWVRGGGDLLLVLDPALSGHYEVPIGDPRHPPATALIPPVVARWGLAVQFDDTQSEKGGELSLPTGDVPLYLAGQIVASPEGDAKSKGDCTIDPSGVLAVCSVGKGRVTLLADADVFEHSDDHEGGDEGGHDHDHDHDHDHSAEGGKGALFALLDHAFAADKD